MPQRQHIWLTTLKRNANNISLCPYIPLLNVKLNSYKLPIYFSICLAISPCSLLDIWGYIQVRRNSSSWEAQRTTWHEWILPDLSSVVKYTIKSTIHWTVTGDQKKACSC